MTLPVSVPKARQKPYSTHRMRDDPEADEAHHQHVQGALDPDHASVEEGETRGHEHHQGGTDEHEPGVGGRQLGVSAASVVMAGAIGVSSSSVRPRAGEA